MTKPVVAVGVLRLVEDGKVSLDDPVSKYIPAFANTTVATRSDTGTVITPARRAITLRDLLTARGERSRYLGPGSGNLDSDVFNKVRFELRAAPDQAEGAPARFMRYKRA